MDEVELLERALVFANTRMGEVRREPGWVQVTLPDSQTDYRNLVVRSVLADEDADARIERARAHYRAVGVDFRWWLTPSSRPLDVAAMIADPGAHEPRPATDVEVAELDASELELYTDVSVAGWGAPAAAWDRFHFAAREKLAGGGSCFLARVGGEPAGTASLAPFEDGAHFSGAVVLPEFRRRGVYRALIDARMRTVRSRGAKFVTNLCRASTSAPICRKLGFRDVCAMRVFSSATRECSSRS
jgi:GNAT superfamily N-acetyltransferase